MSALTLARRCSLALAWLALSCCSNIVNAQSTTAPRTSDSALFEQAHHALERGGYSEAIELLEQLSDRGVIRAAASRNRALAYLLRAESPKQQPGDLGQAVAALRETLQLEPDDQEAQHVLQEVRREISRQRARRGLDPVIVELPLLHALVNLLPAFVWGSVALLGSLALTLGLLLVTRASDSPLRLAGQISCVSGSLLMLLFGGLAYQSEHIRQTRREAVVVLGEAPLLDSQGRAQATKALGLEARAIPEGASVFVTGQQGNLFRISWGSSEAWVHGRQLRVLIRPE